MESPWIFSAFLAPAGDPGTAGGTDPAGTEQLRQIRALRGRILFDGGRRPAFLEPDDQVQDLGAWHFTARRGLDGMHGPPLGYVRLLTPATSARYQSREYLGERQYAEVLAAEGLTDETVFEHSRLVVEHRARKLGLGLHLNALAIAAAHELGAAAMIGTSGTADGQDRFHGRFGFHPVPSTRRYVEKYTEDVVILLHRTVEGAGEHTTLVEGYRLLFRELMAEALAEDLAGGLTESLATRGRGLTGDPAGGLAGTGSAATPAAATPADATPAAATPADAASHSADGLSHPATSPATDADLASLGRGFSGGHAISRLWGAEEAARAVAAVAPGRTARAEAAHQHRNPHRHTPAPSGPPPRLAAIGSSDPHRWKPVLFRPARPDDRVALAALLNTGAVREVVDTVESQVEELIRSREPGRVFDAGELAAAAPTSWPGRSPGTTARGPGTRGPGGWCTCCPARSTGWSAPTATAARSTAPSSGGCWTGGSA
ncbi:hypothetical protein ACFQ9X_51950 [Catenulispora yoronensis]